MMGCLVQKAGSSSWHWLFWDLKYQYIFRYYKGPFFTPVENLMVKNTGKIFLYFAFFLRDFLDETVVSDLLTTNCIRSFSLLSIVTNLFKSNFKQIPIIVPIRFQCVRQSNSPYRHDRSAYFTAVSVKNSEILNLVITVCDLPATPDKCVGIIFSNYPEFLVGDFFEKK